jgi:hypothetical protein
LSGALCCAAAFNRLSLVALYVGTCISDDVKATLLKKYDTILLKNNTTDSARPLGAHFLHIHFKKKQTANLICSVEQ